MRKLIVIIFLIPIFCFAENGKFVQVPNKSTQFQIGVAKNQLVIVTDSFKINKVIYMTDSLFKPTDSMTTVYRSGKYYRFAAGSGATVDTTGWNIADKDWVLLQGFISDTTGWENIWKTWVRDQDYLTSPITQSDVTGLVARLDSIHRIKSYDSTKNPWKYSGGTIIQRVNNKNVGIGTTTPRYRLNLFSYTDTTLLYIDRAQYTHKPFIILDNESMGTSEDFYRIGISWSPDLCSFITGTDYWLKTLRYDNDNISYGIDNFNSNNNPDTLDWTSIFGEYNAKIPGSYHNVTLWGINNASDSTSTGGNPELLGKSNSILRSSHIIGTNNFIGSDSSGTLLVWGQHNLWRSHKIDSSIVIGFNNVSNIRNSKDNILIGNNIRLSGTNKLQIGNKDSLTAPIYWDMAKNWGRWNGTMLLKTIPTISAPSTYLVPSATGVISQATFPTIPDVSNYRTLGNHDSLSTLDEKDYNSLTNKPWTRDITEHSGTGRQLYTTNLTDSVGIGTNEPTALFEVVGGVAKFSAGATATQTASIALSGYVTSGTGVYGQTTTGKALSGYSASGGYAVYGDVWGTGYGLYGNAVTGTGVYATSKTGLAAWFDGRTRLDTLIMTSKLAGTSDSVLIREGNTIKYKIHTAGGSGTVTSILTTSPLTGGEITTTGTIAIIPDSLASWYGKMNNGNRAYDSLANIYTEDQVDNLLSGKANSSHTHAISDVTGLQDSLTNHYTKTQADNKFQLISNLITTTGTSTTKYMSQKAVKDYGDSIAGTKAAFNTMTTIAACIVDSLRQVTTGFNKIPMGEVPYNYTIDTIIFIGYGAALDVTLTICYGTDISAAGTKIVTAGTQVTSVSTATKVSTFKNASIPSGYMIWVYPSAVVTKGASIGVIIKGHRT